METQSNPWGIDAEKRVDWAEGLDIPTLADKPDAEYLYYVGCAGAFDDRNKKTTQAFARDPQEGRESTSRSSASEELCNGETARRLGNEYLFQTMAQMCVEMLNGYSVKKILTNCPHCFNTIKNEFPQFGGKYEVIHATEFVQQLIAAGKLAVRRRVRQARPPTTTPATSAATTTSTTSRATSSRKTGRASSRRSERHSNFGMCCGAGGGRMWMEEEPDKRVNLLRTEQALETNPETIAVACPFCMTMIDDGIKAKDLEEKVQALDVMEIVDRVSAKTP